MLTPAFLHYLSVAIAIGLSGIGSGIGQGIAGFGALSALSRQRIGGDSIFRALVLGLALIESGLILSLVVALILLFGGMPKEITLGIGLAELGMGIAVGCTTAAVGIASSFAVKSACISISRQPHHCQKIITLMLLIQSIIEAPVIFGLLIALLIKTQITDALTLCEGIKLCASGIAIALGSIGPSIGQAIFAKESCSAAGLNTESFSNLLPFSLLSQAVIETPIIFSLVISAILIFKPIAIATATTIAIVSLVVAFTVGFGTGGSAIASGYVASKSAKYIALKKEHYPVFLQSTLLSQAIIESSAIYALIVGLVLVTRVL